MGSPMCMRLRTTVRPRSAIGDVQLRIRSQRDGRDVLKRRNQDGRRWPGDTSATSSFMQCNPSPDQSGWAQKSAMCPGNTACHARKLANGLERRLDRTPITSISYCHRVEARRERSK